MFNDFDKMAGYILCLQYQVMWRIHLPNMIVHDNNAKFAAVFSGLVFIIRKPVDRNLICCIHKTLFLKWVPYAIWKLGFPPRHV